MNETQQETIARVKRTAERLYMEMTAQGDLRISAIRNTTTYQATRIAELAGLVMELADSLRDGPRVPATATQEALPVPQFMPTLEELRAASESMKARASELFSHRLTYSVQSNEWFETATGRSVYFTPYGWQVNDGSGYPDVYVR